jgi:Uncharacterized protein conserved in bacteria (DUF2314)
LSEFPAVTQADYSTCADRAQKIAGVIGGFGAPEARPAHTFLALSSSIIECNSDRARLPKSRLLSRASDSARIPLGEISDWMYVISGEVFGAYTVNLLRSRVGRQERQEHDIA